MDYDLYGVLSLNDILGNEHSILRMRNFCNDVNSGVPRAPLMIFGPSGTGKSAAVHLLAGESGWNVVELNASDYRDKKTIERKLMSAATSRSILGKRNLILLDEIDETSSGFDRGAGAAIGSLVSKSRNPIIFIVNNMWDQSITFLRGKTDALEFRRLPNDTVQKILTNLCVRFSLDVNRNALEMIANRANGDARSAINDMAVIIGAKDDDVTEVIGMRDRKIDVFNVLDKIFLTSTISVSMRAAANTDLTNEMLIKWIDENVPKMYSKGSEMRNAFGALADASMFSARAARTQYYTYWRYMNVLMSAGVALSKESYPSRRSGYSFPRVIKELSSSKATRGQDKAVAEKLQRVFHSSSKRIIRDEMRMLSMLIARSMKENKDIGDEIREVLMRAYLLDDKEADYLIGKGAG